MRTSVGRDCLFLFAFVLLFFALLLAAPFCVSIILDPWLRDVSQTALLLRGEKDWGNPAHFLLLAGFIGAIGGILWRSQMGHFSYFKVHIFETQRLVVLLVFVWGSLCLLGALPFLYLTEASFGDALFESVSALTTTGATLFERTPSQEGSLILWRHQWAWIGGALTLVSIILILMPARIGGLPEGEVVLPGYKRVSVKTGEGFLSVALGIIGVYCLLTLLCFGLLIATGISAFDATCLSLSALSTSGLTPDGRGSLPYGNSSVELVLIIFMFLGGTGFIWGGTFLRWCKRTAQTARLETIWILGSIGSLLLLFLFSFWRVQLKEGENPLFGIGQAAWNGLFTATSLVTSTGFERTAGSFFKIPIPLLLFFAFIGGATLSTAGGLKAYRFLQMLRQSKRELNKLIHPHSIQRDLTGSPERDIRPIKAIWAYFTASVLFLAGASLIFTLEPLSYEAALVCAVSLLANIGPLYSSGSFPDGSIFWPNFSEFGSVSKYTAAMLMFFGRLEILAVLVALQRLLFFR